MIELHFMARDLMTEAEWKAVYATAKAEAR